MPSQATFVPVDDGPDRLLSEQEFLRFMGGMGRTTAWEMRRDGKLRYVRLSPRKVAYPLSEVRRLTAERMQGGQSLGGRSLDNRPN